MTAIGRRDIPVKREMVLKWLQDMNQEERKNVESYIALKLAEQGWDDLVVDMGDELGELPLAEVIYMELDSYGGVSGAS